MQNVEGTEFTLRWDHHDSKLSDTFCKAWEEKLFLDVTLAAGNRTIGAHKLVLCACSPFFESLLLQQHHGTQQQQQQHQQQLVPTSLHPHPMLFFNDIHYDELYALVEFMYRGFLTVTHHNIPAIIRAAHILQIRGLSRGIDEPVDSPPDSSGSEPVNFHQAVKRKHSDADDADEEEPAAPAPPSFNVVDVAVKDETQSEDDDGGGRLHPPSDSLPECIQQQQQQQQQLAAFLSVLSQATPTAKLSYQHPPVGPSPVLRSRLVWDPAHIVLLENWYNRETRYPSVPQSQAYANILSHTQPQDQSGSAKIRGPINVTAQNVSHWFQNRRRKDNHPEIEEKRVKKRSARMKRATPLDLTQHPMSSTYQSGNHHGVGVGGVVQRHHGDSDDDAGSLVIAEKSKSDAEDADDVVHYSSTTPSLLRPEQM